MKKTDPGIFCKRDTTFYYIEYGDMATPRSIIERLLKTLTARNLIRYNQGINELRPDEQYEIFTVSEAEAKGIKTEPIYLSANIRKIVTSRETEERDNAWGKK